MPQETMSVRCLSPRCSLWLPPWQCVPVFLVDIWGRDSSLICAMTKMCSYGNIVENNCNQTVYLGQLCHSLLYFSQDFLSNSFLERLLAQFPHTFVQKISWFLQGPEEVTNRICHIEGLALQLSFRWNKSLSHATWFLFCQIR